jgi:uncharacterized protein YegL
MKKDLFELIVLLDESGSMGSVVTDTIGGFNTFLETHQKLPGEAKLTLVKFDTKYEIVHNGVDVRKALALNTETYTPGGMTALIDAVGRTIDEVGYRLANTIEEERPEKVIFMIITDGEENSSKEYTKEQVKEKTEHQTKNYQWEFIFLGADQDAWANARGIGVQNSYNFMQGDINRTMKGMTYYSSNVRAKSAKTSMDNFDLSDAQLDSEIEKLKNDKKV